MLTPYPTAPGYYWMIDRGQADPEWRVFRVIHALGLPGERWEAYPCALEDSMLHWQAGDLAPEQQSWLRIPEPE